MWKISLPDGRMLKITLSSCFSSFLAKIGSRGFAISFTRSLSHAALMRQIQLQAGHSINCMTVQLSPLNAILRFTLLNLDDFTCAGQSEVRLRLADRVDPDALADFKLLKSGGGISVLFSRLVRIFGGRWLPKLASGRVLEF